MNKGTDLSLITTKPNQMVLEWFLRFLSEVTTRSSQLLIKVDAGLNPVKSNPYQEFLLLMVASEVIWKPLLKPLHQSRIPSLVAIQSMSISVVIKRWNLQGCRNANGQGEKKKAIIGAIDRICVFLLPKVPPNLKNVCSILSYSMFLVSCYFKVQSEQYLLSTTNYMLDIHVILTMY